MPYCHAQNPASGTLWTEIINPYSQLTGTLWTETLVHYPPK
jgi:hypothetical protein